MSWATAWKAASFTAGERLTGQVGTRIGGMSAGGCVFLGLFAGRKGNAGRKAPGVRVRESPQAGRKFQNFRDGLLKSPVRTASDRAQKSAAGEATALFLGTDCPA